MTPELKAEFQKRVAANPSSDLGVLWFRVCELEEQVDEPGKLNYGHPPVQHARSDGAVVLARKVLEALGGEK